MERLGVGASGERDSSTPNLTLILPLTLTLNLPPTPTPTPTLSLTLTLTLTPGEARIDRQHTSAAEGQKPKLANDRVGVGVERREGGEGGERAEGDDMVG